MVRKLKKEMQRPISKKDDMIRKSIRMKSRISRPTPENRGSMSYLHPEIRIITGHQMYW